MSRAIRLLTPGDINDAAMSLVMDRVLYNRASLPIDLQQKLLRNHQLRLYGIPRGGVPAAYAVQSAFLSKDVSTSVVSDPAQADIFIDDIIDSGKTRVEYAAMYPGVPFLGLFESSNWNWTATGVDAPWLVFPWEGSVLHSASDIPLRLLEFIGENVDREGLKETPERFLKAWQEWCSGYHQDPAEVFKSFTDGAEKVDEMVLVKDIPVYSHCEHHLAPFFGEAHVAYIPNGKIVGLSKIPRLVQIFMRRLQVQERLTQQIANTLAEALQPLGVAVVLECRHMCMESRGVKTPGSVTVTSCMLGAFKTNYSARQEFMGLVQ